MPTDCILKRAHAGDRTVVSTATPPSQEYEFEHRFNDLRVKEHVPFRTGLY